ncbi:MAG: hypothetical protein JST00_34750 [Deltaproteobacteria bacterium]|nr:hypothetical protein [Deltaproteobacteria bacterium]
MALVIEVSPMFSRLRFVLGVLVGTCIVHVALVACTTTSYVTAPERAAKAEPSAPTGGLGTPCTQWEAKAFLPKSYAFTKLVVKEVDGKSSNIDIPTFEATTLPEGWEPIGGEGYGSIIARHCVK